MIITGEIADYRFYENFNLGDVLSVAGFFGKEGVLIVLSLLLFTFLIHYLGRLIQRRYKNQTLVFSTFVIALVIMSLNGGIVHNAYATMRLKFAGNATFKEALSALQINDGEYVYRNKVKAAKGKNIIVLSLESLEIGYLSDKLGHLTPNLSKLAEKYSLFPMEQAPAGGWTSASMYLTMTGVPAYFGVHGNSVFQQSYEHKLTSLSDVLLKAGYDLQYFIGRKEFSGIDDMLKMLGFTVKSEKDFIEKYETVDWGIQDKDLFKEFKEELKRLKDSEEPFALFLSTISTHFPNGVPDKRMDSMLPPQKSRLELMVSATDYHVGDLMDFLDKEGMMDNTIFFIYPDHLLMGNTAPVMENFDKRQLYVLTNANASKLNYSEGETVNQIDLPKIILNGAEIEHNAKFLTDFIPQEDKNAFLRSNDQNLLRLNDAALKTQNCKDGIFLAINEESGMFEISNDEDILFLSQNIPQKGNCHRILFDENFRPIDNFIISYSQVLAEPKSHAYLDVFVTNDLLHGSLKGMHHFGITKNGTKEVAFNKSEIALLHSIDLAQDKQRYIQINSNSWNAKKASSFHIKNVTENIARGLTVISFQAGDSHEFRTFDTYQSQEEAKALVGLLKQLTQDNASFVILAHDSAAKSLHPHHPVLKQLGFEKMSLLEDRQAYVAHNLNGRIVEFQDDTSINIDVLYPKDVKNTAVYFSQPKLDFEPKIDRYIAHAGGIIDGVKYTNSKEALDQSYSQGFRIFELDILETSDGAFVAAHDCKHWAKEANFKGDTPVSRNEFLAHKLRGKYAPLDMVAINKWFKEHPDAILVTDKVNEPLRFSGQFVDKARLRMELFSLPAIEEASQNGISILISDKPRSQIKGDVISYLKDHKVEYVTMSRRGIMNGHKLLKTFRENDIKVYVYHVNFDAGKDESYVYSNEIGLVYGMYADKWIPAFKVANKSP